jgi:IMP dehydrogenase
VATQNPDYREVFIYPQYSEITSRTQVDTSLEVKNKGNPKCPDFKVDVPVISANMDTVTDGNMALAIHRAGGIGGIHRFMSIEENVKQFKLVKDEGGDCLVSVGVNPESQERALALYNSGARNFIIDIAHGHSLMMKDMIAFMRKSFGSTVIIMAGNVATSEGCLALIQWGADAIKIGIGPGAVCTTKNVTGVTVPQFAAVQECCSEENRHVYNLTYQPDTSSSLARYMSKSNYQLTRPLLVADGGIQEIGDIAKALGAGADLVMCGRLFASCQEAPGPRINGKKVYRGMASRDAMLTIKDAAVLPTPEGVSTVLDISGETVADVIKHIKGGLQSSMSYSNARNLDEFKDKAVFGGRK